MADPRARPVIARAAERFGWTRYRRRAMRGDGVAAPRHAAVGRGDPVALAE